MVNLKAVNENVGGVHLKLNDLGHCQTHLNSQTVYS